jgi:hypothetical protein
VSLLVKGKHNNQPPEALKWSREAENRSDMAASYTLSGSTPVSQYIQSRQIGSKDHVCPFFPNELDQSNDR